jgi:hypothetical protein
MSWEYNADSSAMITPHTIISKIVFISIFNPPEVILIDTTQSYIDAVLFLTLTQHTHNNKAASREKQRNRELVTGSVKGATATKATGET